MMDSIKKHKTEILLQIFLLLFALTCLLSSAKQYPLVDYDEATYAKVTVDTLESGDILTLKRFGEPWFDKPPLYFWLAMGSIKIFGTQEFAFRLPSIIMAALSLWIAYLIVKQLTGNRLIAASVFLITLFSPVFFAFSREARLDSGVVMSLLLALLCTIRGWKNSRYLLFVFPAIGIGFLLKSFAIVIVPPVLLIYSFFYGQWRWLKNKHLWIGSLVSAVLLLPWHVIQFQRFGRDFWNSYFLWHVYQRAVSTLSGSNRYFDYLGILWKYNQPWTFLLLCSLLALIILFLVRNKINYRINKFLFAPLFSALFIVLFFTSIRTHLPPYILPALIFINLFFVSFFYGVSSYLKVNAVTVIGLVIMLIIGMVNSAKVIKILVQPYHYEERDVALIYNNKRDSSPVYALDWPFLETISYYGETKVNYLDVRKEGEKTLKGPLYLLTNTLAMQYFYDSKGFLLSRYADAEELYRGSYLGFIYSEKDFTLPNFDHK